MVQFRMKALNQMQKPDDLDLLMKVTKRRGWIGVGVLGVALTALIIWSFAGSIPSQVPGTGVISGETGISEIQTYETGFVTEVSITAGQKLVPGDSVAKIETERGTVEVKAEFPGTVTAVLIDGGNVIRPADTMYRLERSDTGDGEPLAFVFIEATEVAGIAPGMGVDLAFDAVPSSAFGVMRGTVKSVDAYPLDRAAIVGLLGDPDYADELVADGEPVLVRVSLEKDPSTSSGYKWSSSSGPPFAIPPGARLTALIDQGATRPIDLVFGK